MAYIPPHKRHLKDIRASSPLRPELLSPLFEKNLKFRSSSSTTNSNAHRSGKIVYANTAISRWFSVGLDDPNQLPASVHLQPVSLESVERKVGENSLTLINSDLEESAGGNSERFSKNPWDYIAENVMKDLLSSFEFVRSEMESQTLEEVRPTLVARLGKVVFRGSSSVNQESVGKDLVDEDALRRMKRSFKTNLPKSYMESILQEGVPKIGVEFEDEKDIYHVKVELNQVRHMVMDISCLEKNLDLRLMLCTKRIITPTDDDMKSIRDLIDFAVLDSGVKGGLRWPFGKATSGEKFSVVGAWHIVAKSYKNASLRLKVRDADRFDYRASIGEESGEIVIKLKRVVSELKEQQSDVNLITEMLKDNLKVVWNNLF
ncbi:hypothetical protein TIFTF001_001106 [Ficus carica]|uniref:DUF7903 domain-containing protein n=1 Tax=Ficus carica TaxID=3494 RepID=A0AA87Z5R2_FICCA|nr:hypothetical protein TIFTF001_001106 [Ficus carica]